MSKLKLIFIALFALAVVGCYDDYIAEYKFTSAYFATQKPLRSVIGDRTPQMNIKIGAAISGRLATDKSDWVEFKIDSKWLDGKRFTLLPTTHYTLSDASLMKVRGNNPIADVDVNFTEAFFDDALSYSEHYALPFEITDSSLDKIMDGEKDSEGNYVTDPRNYSIVAVKCLSKFHGTYFLRGEYVEIQGIDEVDGSKVIYNNKDLSANPTRYISSVNRYVIEKPGLGNMSPSIPTEGVKITFTKSGKGYDLTLSGIDGGLELSATSASYDVSSDRPTINLAYTFTKSSKTYKVNEQLILRQDPLKDLRFEEWQ